ncbi:MAG TPA: UDP-N-acetylmuramate--L-alanine ligase [Tepidisphaeraceae bacterium]|nr:UDP-N-acetylmuramate--L-alanine ligase [Tepidisphaeraceae bacterium]
MSSIMHNAVSELRTESRSAGSRSRFTGRRVHFIGIGGSGMSGLARMLLDSGAAVSGSEPKPNQQTFDLMRRGVKISRTQSGELLSRDIDLVVRTAAVPETNGEYLTARAMHLPQMKYAELLGQVMAERLGVAIAGTHGKSTTTAMTAFALLACGADPSFVVGGTVAQLGGGSHSGAGASFIAEACEYDRSFHNLRPTIACITNIEADHLDCYRNLQEIIESFRTFAQLVPADGLVLANGADANVHEALRGIKATIQTIAIDGPATWSTRIVGEEAGCYRGEVLYDRKPVARLSLSVAGLHNLFNATLAIAACNACGVDPAAAAAAVGRFTGVDRRMTEMGRFNGAIVVDDYGHHPTEIRATLAALRGKYRPQRLICVFQPHQASRTRLLLEDFGKAFTDADETVMPDIYYVRDSDAERARTSTPDLVERITANGQRARHLPKFEQITEYLRGEGRDGDLIVTMGAGNVWEIGRDLVQ